MKTHEKNWNYRHSPLLFVDTTMDNIRCCAHSWSTTRSTGSMRFAIRVCLLHFLGRLAFNKLQRLTKSHHISCSTRYGRWKIRWTRVMRLMVPCWRWLHRRWDPLWRYLSWTVQRWWGIKFWRMKFGIDTTRWGMTGELRWSVFRWASQRFLSGNCRLGWF